MKAIDERKLTRKARVEIVNAVYSRMIAHAEYPTSDQYSTICWRLVEKFDALRDKMGNGIVHIVIILCIHSHSTYNITIGNMEGTNKAKV